MADIRVKAKESYTISNKTAEKLQMFANIVREFCSNTTVHGFRYFTERNLSWIERMWWLVSIIVLVVLSTFGTWHIWANWQNRPVIVSFDDKRTSIRSIPFPAVTICSSQIVDSEKLNVDDLLERFFSFNASDGTESNLTSDDMSMVDALIQLCFDRSEAIFSRHLIIPCGSIYDTIKTIAPNASITTGITEFGRRNINFHPIYTELGLCYTFNSLNSRDIYSDEIANDLLTVDQNPSTDWSIEDGYNNSFEETYPVRVFSTKTRDIFTAYVGLLSNNNDLMCTESVKKFHFTLHSPDTLPRIAEDFMLLQRNQESHVTVRPILMKTSEGLRRYSPETRDCFFKSERKLRLFKAYNQNNCELECMANYTQRACNCMPFYLPRDNVTRVCTMFDYQCYKKADDDFTKWQGFDQCNCLPDCIALTYNSISSQADLYDLGNSTDLLYSRLQISFKHSHFIGITRSETSTLADFIASFGGLLGLFMGISILSVIELVYYFTLRLFFKFRREKTRRIVRVAPASRIPRLIPTNITIRISGSQNLSRN